MGLRKTYGIDTGTDSVKIYSLSRDAFYSMKNMIAVRDDRKVIAVGDEAFEMFEKTPSNIQVDSPMAFGMIADIPRMEYVLYQALRRIDRNPGLGTSIYFAVPMDLSKLEKRAYDAIANGGRMNKVRVFMVEKPVADAIALGIPLETSKGSMIVNIGSQSTEISVLAEGKVIISKMIPVGGRQFNGAICEELRRLMKLQVGLRTAGTLKLTLGNLGEYKAAAKKVFGIDSLSGLPREEAISSKIVNDALLNPARTIGDEIRTFLERTPPQISYEIMKEGIFLTGGSTRLPGINRFLAEYVGYGMTLSELYEQCTVSGLRRMINDRQLQKWAVPFRQRRM